MGRGIALLFHDRGTRSEWVVSSCPGRTLPPGNTRYPLYRSMGEPQSRSGRAENLVPTGIRSRTFQPVVQSLYRLSYPAHWLHMCVFPSHLDSVCFCILKDYFKRIFQHYLPIEVSTPRLVYYLQVFKQICTSHFASRAKCHSLDIPLHFLAVIIFC